MGSIRTPGRSLLALVAAVCFASNAASADADRAAPPPSAAGTLSTVTLIDVSRLPDDVLHAVLPGAEDGLVFLFLVVKHPGVSGVPALNGLRELRVNRASYRESTAAALGTDIAPLNFVEDVNKFLARVAPETAAQPVAPEGEAWVMVTTIGGARLPERGRGEIEIEVGWGGETETVPFAFALPPAVADGSPNVPAVPGQPAVPRRLEGAIRT